MKNEKPCGIYRIKNVVTNKVYIGSSVNILRRWANHKYLLRNNGHPNTILQHSYNKHGDDAFVFEVIEEVPNPKNLTEREQHYIDRYQAANRDFGYNLNAFAANSTGRIVSEETRRKLSARVVSDETRRKLSAIFKGRPQKPRTADHCAKISEGLRRNPRVYTPEMRAKMSASHLGKKRSSESLAKLSATLKGRKLTPEHARSISEGKMGKPLSEAHKQSISKGNSKLTYEQALKIKVMRDSGMYLEEIARQYGVNRQSISNYLRRLENRTLGG